MPADIVGERIEQLRRRYGAGLMILGHFYQRDSVIKHADRVGDSLELARAAADSSALRIVLCGVRFMAESACILAGPERSVYMPDTGAGCPMAAMADPDQVERAWRDLGGDAAGFLPVVYVNSSAAVKALCGRWGGSTCTSSNARRVFEWVFSQGRRVFFLPDEHLGINTAEDMGLRRSETAVYDPRREGGGLARADLDRARVVVWKGFCVVHMAFTADLVMAVRRAHPEAKIIVHPETPSDVVRLCDAHGSTSQIVRYVEEAPDGSLIVVGTEQHLVERLAEKWRGRKTVKALAGSVCANMARTTPEALLALLERWPESLRVTVDPGAAADARLALNRMLALAK